MEQVRSRRLSLDFGLSFPLFVKHTCIHTAPSIQSPDWYMGIQVDTWWYWLIQNNMSLVCLYRQSFCIAISVLWAHFNLNSVYGSSFLYAIFLDYLGDKPPMRIFNNLQVMGKGGLPMTLSWHFMLLPLKPAPSLGVWDSSRERAITLFFLAFPSFWESEYTNQQCPVYI